MKFQSAVLFTILGGASAINQVISPIQDTVTMHSKSSIALSDTVPVKRLLRGRSLQDGGDGEGGDGDGGDSDGGDGEGGDGEGGDGDGGDGEGGDGDGGDGEGGDGDGGDGEGGDGDGGDGEGGDGDGGDGDGGDGEGGDGDGGDDGCPGDGDGGDGDGGDGDGGDGDGGDGDGGDGDGGDGEGGDGNGGDGDGGDGNGGDGEGGDGEGGDGDGGDGNGGDGEGGDGEGGDGDGGDGDGGDGEGGDGEGGDGDGGDGDGGDGEGGDGDGGDGDGGDGDGGDGDGGDGEGGDGDGGDGDGGDGVGGDGNGGCEDGGDSGGIELCFSGKNTVEVMGKGTVSLDTLKIGDSVRVMGDNFAKVYSFGHYHKSQKSNYLQIKTTEGNTLEITPKHMVFVESGGSTRSVPASSIKVGDILATNSEKAVEVSKIGTVQRKGAYAPFTISGDIVVSGIAASNYISIMPEEEIGLPVSMQWIAHTFNAPHRFVCTAIDFSICENETYTREGLSTWIALPYYTAEWLANQSSMVKFIGSATLVASMSLGPIVCFFLAAGFLYKKNKKSKVE